MGAALPGPGAGPSSATLSAGMRWTWGPEKNSGTSTGTPPSGPRGRWECFRCSSKVYDLGKPDPICPKCGADQREKPREKPTPSTPPPEKPRRANVPMGSLLDEDEEPIEEFEAEETDLAGLDAEAFLSESPEEEEEEVDVNALDEE